MTDTVPASDLPTVFTPSEVEGVLYEKWVSAGYFAPEIAGPDAEPFTIVIPPPNVTGELHMGHALDHTIIDALTRRARMQGKAALWLPGTDHASIAVETLVERQLVAEGLTKAEVGREAFLERAWAWRESYGGKILDQMRRLGDGVDWSRLRFTMEPSLSSAVRVMFKKLYDEGLIYRAERLVNWSPAMGSAVSDIEVIHRDVEGELVTLDYGPAVDGSPVHVATTRVETMLGDTAVAVNPSDERYQHLIGTTVTLPLVGRLIPIIGDEHVDPSFGTGMVKITPAHDANDFAMGQRHDLPMLTVLDVHGNIDGTRTRFDGLDRFDARREIKEELRAQGRVVAEKIPYLHSVGHSERGGEPIEPRLSMQWWVSVDKLATSAGDAVRDGRTVFNPPEMADRYFAWTDDLRDWCISRQLFWGHRIPVWFGPSGEMVCPAEGDEPTGEGWVQESDVLDTWFSSALWPFSTLGWPAATSDLARFYPTSVLVTGYDIIFFWVVRMMMFGTYAEVAGPGSVPFEKVHIHGLVRDAHGLKMSKSRGNVINPLDWVDTYGADALRFSLARGANPGTDFPLSEDAVRGAGRFTNKLWNATRFALMNGALAPLDDSGFSAPPPASRLAGPDRWLLSRLSTVVAEVDELYAMFEFARVAELLYGFAWNEVFDWYVELAKAPIAAGGQRAADTRAVLGHVLDVTLRLLHPIIPFVTETLWTSLTGAESIVIARWPVPDASRFDATAEGGMRALQAMVNEVRRVRGAQRVAPAVKLPAVLVSPDAGLAAYTEELAALGGLALRVGSTAPEGWTLVTTPEGVVALDFAGTIDVHAERARWVKDLAEAELEVGRQEARLSGPAAAKAPAAVVDGWRGRLAEAQADVVRLRKLLGQ